MSEYTENILITEIDEVKEEMRERTDGLTRERLELSLNLNEINNKYDPKDLLTHPTCVHGNDFVRIYEGNIWMLSEYDIAPEIHQEVAEEIAGREFSNPVAVFTNDFLDDEV